MARKPRIRQRRGAAATIALMCVVGMFIIFGVELDSGRLFVARHKDQIIADAVTMAAAMKLPREADASAAGNRIISSYHSIYNPDFTVALNFQRNARGLATGITVDVNENVPMVFPVLMWQRT